MVSMKKFSLVLCALAVTVILGCSNSNGPLAPTTNGGSVKISLKLNNTTAPAAAMMAAGTVPTITSAQVVIKKIEFKSTGGDSMDFELKQPFVQDLLTMDTLQVIQNVSIPFGSYKGSEIKIDVLKSQDGSAFSQNPELQGKSILVKGYLNGDPAQTFTFTSSQDVEQEVDFASPLIIDENSPSTNVVLSINMNTWLVDSNGNPLDPTNPQDRSKIEENIKRSFKVFEDKDDNGKDDDHESDS